MDQPTVTLPEHRSAYHRTIVIGDIHGDLDIMLQSLSEKKLLHYDGDVAGVIRVLKEGLTEDHLEDLETMVIRQEPRCQLVFLGDLVDRYHHGYHAVQFLKKVRWHRFGIDLIVLLGNHDLHNLQFFVNPYAAYQLYSESEHALEEVMDFIGRMGLPQSLDSFFDLHRDEIETVQRDFYRTGRLEWPLPYGSLVLSYQRDLSLLADYRGETLEDLWTYLKRAAEAFGFSWQPHINWMEGINAFTDRLALYEGGQTAWNWWDIAPRLSEELTENAFGGYDPKLRYFNIWRRDVERGGKPLPFVDVLLVDWRVISLVWRKHYGSFFRRMKVLHLDGNNLYAHGGISPQTMVDSQGFGALYSLSRGLFLKEADERRFGLKRTVQRCNRLARQVMDNALNDLSFTGMCGTEIIDAIGQWRGGRRGFTEFGGFLWADFEFLRTSVRGNQAIAQLYREFIDASGLRRVVCGHTRFQDHGDPELRYLRIRELYDMGLDYICVDNSCSRGYRMEPVRNGIEIDADGEILGPGKDRVQSPW